MLKIIKYKAFTLSEMLVVLLLTVIVVGLAFSVLNLVQKQMYSAQENYEASSEFARLQQGLWWDFRSATEVRYDQGSYRFTTPISTRQYRIDSLAILRGGDSLHLKVIEELRFFKGKAVLSGPVDAIQWTIKEGEQTRSLMVYKRNSAENTMNYGL